MNYLDYEEVVKYEEVILIFNSLKERSKKSVCCTCFSDKNVSIASLSVKMLFTRTKVILVKPVLVGKICLAPIDDKF